MTFVSVQDSGSSLDRAGQRARLLMATLAVVATGGCFSPNEPATDGTADGTASSSMSSSGGPSGSSGAGPDSTTTISGGSTISDVDTTVAVDDTSAAETTTGEPEGTSTGQPSDCPGGDPTPGDAPYLLTTVLTTQDANAIDLGHIDGDAHLDIISLSRLDGAVETLWGDGSGTFVADGVKVLDASGFPDTVRLGAIADDTVDLFVHMEGPVNLWVVRGDGAGNWPTPQVYMGTYVRAIDIADFNGDDVLDLAYVGASNLEVRLGAATETYAAPTLYGVNTGNVLRVADITGDGQVDIVTAEYNASELQIYAGDGNGNFVAQATLVTGSAITGADAGLLDDDDRLDLVLTTANDLRVFYGVPGGGISSTPDTLIPNARFRVRTADVDADGRDDVVTHGNDTVEVRFSAGDTTFSEPSSFSCPSSVRAIEIGDLNEDCVPDIVAALDSGQDLCVLLSDRD